MYTFLSFNFLISYVYFDAEFFVLENIYEKKSNINPINIIG